MTARVVVQARMGSRRLPGKVLAPIDGEPMLSLLVGRLRRCRTADGVIVATSTAPEDDAIEDACAKLDVELLRGSQDDVLSRFVAIAERDDRPLVRVTGDCPLIDPEIADLTVRRFQQTAGCAYASNIEPRSFPDGLDVEVISAPALRAAGREAEDPADREHVTPFIRRDTGRFPRTSLVHEEDLGELRWTVDEAADLEFVRSAVLRLGERRYEAGLAEILAVARTEPALCDVGGFRRC